MEATSTGANRLHIGRLRAEYLVPASHPTPRRVQDQLDTIFAKQVPDVLRATLSRWPASSDESIWLIRRLEVHLAVNTGWDRDQAARCFARSFTKALAQTVQESGGDVLRFPNRAAYLAQFLTDLAAGHAWSAWYYDAFRGLRVLPVSAALRTAICEEPRIGLDALLALSEGAMDRVLTALTAPDARRVLDQLPAATTSEDAAGSFEQVWAAWRERQLNASPAGREPQAALRLYLQACRRQPASSSPMLKAMARALVRLARRLDESPAGERLLAALTVPDPASVYVVAGAGDAEVLRPLRQVPPARVQAAGRALLARRSGPVSTAAQRSTAFGGLFLLLPLLDALPAEELTRDWPGAGDTSAAALLRFLTLLKCLGQPRARRAFGDALVRELLGIDPALTRADVARWQADHASRRRLDRLLAEWAVWQREHGTVRGDALALVLVSLPGAPAGVVLDLRRGDWLFAAGYSPRRPHRMVRRVQAWLRHSGYAPQVFVSDAVFAGALQAACPNIPVHLPDSPAAAEMAPHTRIREDLDYLRWPRSFRSVRSSDLALSVVAQGVLRAFAGRLPGFAASSLPYLFHNFLDIPARMEDEPARHVVRLGQPPIQYVLGLTGMARSTYRLGWLDERPFVLFQE